MQIEMTIKGLMVDPITNMPIIILRADLRRGSRDRQCEDRRLRSREWGLRAAPEMARESRPRRHGQVQDVNLPKSPEKSDCKFPPLDSQNFRARNSGDYDNFANP